VPHLKRYSKVGFYLLFVVDIGRGVAVSAAPKEIFEGRTLLVACCSYPQRCCS